MWSACICCLARIGFIRLVCGELQWTLQVAQPAFILFQIGIAIAQIAGNEPPDD